MEVDTLWEERTSVEKTELIPNNRNLQYKRVCFTSKMRIIKEKKNLLKRISNCL